VTAAVDVGADGAEVDTAAPGTQGGPSEPVRALDRRLAVVAVVAAVVPIVVAAVRAVHSGWLPVADNGFFELRSRDVFTGNHPLLGTWSSASRSAGVDFNNPGPLLFDWLALPVKLLAPGPGVAFGVAALNCAAIVGIAVFARRRGGALTVVVAMAASAGLAWTMGSELLFDPWQPHSMLLPFLLYLFLAWSLACGDAVALPWAVGVGSLVVETHLSYGLLVPLLGAFGVVAFVAWRRHRRRPVIDARVRRILLVALLVGALCWAQPAWEQLTGPGEGNIHRIASNGGRGAAAIGTDLGPRLAAEVLSMPPWWGRSSFADDFVPVVDGPRFPTSITRIQGLPTLAKAVGSLATLVAALAAAWFAVRRSDRTSARALATAALAAAVSVVMACLTPKGEFGIAAHQLRFLWPVAVFLTFALVLTAARFARSPRARTGAVAVMAAATVAFGLANLPTHNQHVGPSYNADAIPYVRDLQRQMVVLQGRGRLLFDARGVAFGEPWTAPVMAELDRRGIPFVVDDAGLVRQVGEGRRQDGPVDGVLMVRQGEAALDGIPGTERVALVRGLSAAEEQEWSTLRAQIAAFLARGELRLDADGTASAKNDLLPETARQMASATPDADAWLASTEIPLLAQEHLLALDPTWTARFDRYAALQTAREQLTVGLFVGPPGFDAMAGADG
jgi:hypothetical protein